MSPINWNCAYIGLIYFISAQASAMQNRFLPLFLKYHHYELSDIALLKLLTIPLLIMKLFSGFLIDFRGFIKRYVLGLMLFLFSISIIISVVCYKTSERLLYVSMIDTPSASYLNLDNDGISIIDEKMFEEGTTKTIKTLEKNILLFSLLVWNILSTLQFVVVDTLAIIRYDNLKYSCPQLCSLITRVQSSSGKIGIFLFSLIFSNILINYIQLHQIFFYLSIFFLFTSIIQLYLIFHKSSAHFQSKTISVKNDDQSIDQNRMEELKQNNNLNWKFIIFLSIYRLSEQGVMNLLPMYMLGRENVSMSTISFWTTIIWQIATTYGSMKLMYSLKNLFAIRFLLTLTITALIILQRDVNLIFVFSTIFIFSCGMMSTKMISLFHENSFSSTTRYSLYQGVEIISKSIFSYIIFYLTQYYFSYSFMYCFFTLLSLLPIFAFKLLN
ncbi:hypothetical protein SNEBB_002006 [Seison nebaliae]|nr:hypothetical protein SNEBB_002006 [Seison nebaliae]